MRVPGELQGNLQKVESFCAELESMNQGTYAYVANNENDEFDHLYMFPSWSVRRGLAGCMNMTQLDCAHMRGNMYHGHLMCLVSMDGNGKMCPLGMGLVPTVSLELVPGTVTHH